MPSLSEVSFLDSELLFNRYVIRQILQQDEFEAVYLAEDQDSNNESCILRKLISPEGNFTEIQKSQCEQKLARFVSLQHSQTQQIKSCHWGEKELFIAHSYIEGKSYQQLLAEGMTLTEHQVLELLNHLVPVLAYLHRCGIAHQNISPNSIVRRPGDGLPVLKDWGVFQEIRAQLGMPATEAVFYSPDGTMPTERLQAGFSHDLYLLGITVIVLLTGQSLRVLYSPQTQRWEFEEWKLISDELATLLNRMVVNPGYIAFTDADSLLQFLATFTNFNVVPSPVTPPTSVASPGYQAPTYSQPVADENSVSSAPPYSQSAMAYQPGPSTVIHQPTVIQPGSNPSAGQTNKIWLIGLGGGILLTLSGIFAILLVKELGNKPAPSGPVQVGNPVPASPSTIGQPPAPTGGTVSPPASPSPPAPPSPPVTQLTKQDAVNLLDNWMRAKSKIFAPPFDTSLAAAYTTGKIYDDIVKPDGSIRWLQQENAFYRYGNYQVKPTGFFTANPNYAQIDVQVIQEIFYYKNGRMVSSKTDTGYYRFTFRLESGTWKIAERESR